METNEVPTLTTAEKLLFLGGKEWQKHGKHRIYINPAIIRKVIGFKYSKHKSGNIRNAYLGGSKLSDNKARILKSVIENANMFYDIPKQRYYYNHSGTDFDDNLKEFIELISEATFKDLENWNNLPNPMFN